MSNQEAKQRRNSYTVTFKCEVVAYAKKTNKTKAAIKYKISRTQVQHWCKDKEKLTALSENNCDKCKRLKGAGRKVKYLDLEDKVYQWILNERSAKRPISRRLILLKAQKLAMESNIEFAGSNGWLDRFFSRKGLSMRQATPIVEKPHSDFMNKIIDFVKFIRKLRIGKKYPLSSIIACDETPVWLNVINETNEMKKNEQICIFECKKSMITVMLTAKADGTKLKPFVLINQIEPIKDLEEFTSKLIIVYSDTSWMNDDLTKQFVQEVIGASIFDRQLLIWDSFKCHINDSIQLNLMQLNIDMAAIPRGCSKFVQPSVVSWNKPFKESIKRFYCEWLETGSIECEDGDVLRRAPLKCVCKWIVDSWELISTDVIVESFRVCGISNAIDGSEDDEIGVFKKFFNGDKGLEFLNRIGDVVDQHLEEDSEQEFLNTVVDETDDEESL